MSNRRDTNIEPFLDENIVATDDFDDILRSFNAILFQDDKLKILCTENIDLLFSFNILKEKESFEEFSDMLAKLEEDGENLDPIILGSGLDGLCKPMMAAPLHIPPIAQQNPMHSDQSEDLKVQEMNTSSVNNEAMISEKNGNCLRDIDDAKSFTSSESNEGSTFTSLQKSHNVVPSSIWSIDKCLSTNKIAQLTNNNILSTPSNKSSSEKNGDDLVIGYLETSHQHNRNMIYFQD